MAKGRKISRPPESKDEGRVDDGAQHGVTHEAKHDTESDSNTPTVPPTDVDDDDMELDADDGLRYVEDKTRHQTKHEAQAEAVSEIRVDTEQRSDPETNPTNPDEDSDIEELPWKAPQARAILRFPQWPEGATEEELKQYNGRKKEASEKAKRKSNKHKQGRAHRTFNVSEERAAVNTEISALLTQTQGDVIEIDHPGCIQESLITAGLSQLGAGPSMPQFWGNHPVKLALLKPLANSETLADCTNHKTDFCADHSEPGQMCLDIYCLGRAWRQELLKVPPMSFLIFDITIPVIKYQGKGKARAKDTDETEPQLAWGDCERPCLVVSMREVIHIATTIATTMKIRGKNSTRFAVMYDPAQLIRLDEMIELKEKLRALSR
ncbi:uncharacterized protein BO72DRAFT_525978 [Aspergillus fijiensis CBS 313.89]|uniref:Uncharacterized protein n=1 Tax=Aspergillus fijiensis CBS 313.89 TaxID=1448319 RepID=A0A8G1RV68_9EURO|nr:uncharacterized protein BO72DRAFT_525978 [Aspergillus fijiensis CBS 313.89]RAK79302.1 hypothetical protein BO72DRAFT_525978 [Aspergillus fijiensis CBS 313.89]